MLPKERKILVCAAELAVQSPGAVCKRHSAARAGPYKLRTELLNDLEHSMSGDLQGILRSSRLLRPENVVSVAVGSNGALHISTLSARGR